MKGIKEAFIDAGEISLAIHREGCITATLTSCRAVWMM